MKCPYCNEEMKQGEIRSQDGAMIFWKPVPGRSILNIYFSKRAVEKDGGVILAKSQNNLSDPIVGYVCGGCHKYIMSF